MGAQMPKGPTPSDIKSLARSYTAKGIKVLAGIMMQPKATDMARIAAVKELFNRGWGAAPVNLSDDGEALVVNIIRYSDSDRANGKDRSAPQLESPSISATPVGRA